MTLLVHLDPTAHPEPTVHLESVVHLGPVVHLEPATGAAGPVRRPEGRPTIGLDLTSLGAHHAPWPVPPDDPRAEIDLTRVRELTTLADRSGIDFVAFDDAFALTPAAARTTAGRLDAARVACRMAPVTTRVGLLATIDTGHLDPMHVSTAVGTLHTRSAGRAGWQVGAAQARSLGETPEAWDRLALEIQRVVKGWTAAGIEARERPDVVVRVTSPRAAEVAGALADVARIDALDAATARERRAEIRAAAAAAGRDPDEVTVIADLVAIVSRDALSARIRRDILADLLPGEPAWQRTVSHLGTADQLADLIDAWFTERVVDGFTVLPGSLPHDARVLAGEVLPALGERGLAAVAYPPAA